MVILTNRKEFELVDKYIPQAEGTKKAWSDEYLDKPTQEVVGGHALTYEEAVEVLEAFEPWMGEFVNDARLLDPYRSTLDEMVARWPGARGPILHEFKGDMAGKQEPWDITDAEVISWLRAANSSATAKERQGTPPNRSVVFSTMLDVYFDNRYARPHYQGVLFTFMANDYRTRLGKKVRTITWHRFNREKALAAEGKFWKDDRMLSFDEYRVPSFPAIELIPVEAGPGKGKFKTSIEYWQNDERTFATSKEQLRMFVRDWWENTATWVNPEDFASEDDAGLLMEMATRAFDERFAEGKPLHDLVRDYFEAVDGRLQGDSTLPEDIHAIFTNIIFSFRDLWQETISQFYEWHVRRGRERPVLLLRVIPSWMSTPIIDFYDIHDKVEVRYPPGATFFS